MLSRVADNLYWFGRYVQRAENTARLASVHANLILDMPRRVVVAWESLVDITGSRDGFLERYEDFSEANVVRFLLVDDANPGSILSSLSNARQILRGSRDTMPREVWEEVNKLYWFVRDTVPETLERRRRGDFLERVIRSCLLIDGMLYENMSRDLTFCFLSLGSNLEQADMTSRIVDASALGLLPHHQDELLPFSNIQWRSVLLSLTAYQMYRRQVRRRVSGPKVVQFLIQDRHFPRAVAWNLDAICRTLSRIPNHDQPLRVARTIRARVTDADLTVLPQTQVSDYVDDLQGRLAQLGNVLTEHYFRPELAQDAMSQSQ